MAEPFEIIGSASWWASAAGIRALAWEQAVADEVLADAFGFHALQLGLPEVNTLAGNRMPHRWLALQGLVAAPTQEPVVSLTCDFDALPFPSQSIDLVVLPHALEYARDAHLTLREVERVLVPEGRVLITGFNPWSLMGLARSAGRLRWMKQRRGRPDPIPSDQSLGSMAGGAGETVSVHRLRDWLRLLGFEVEAARFGCFGPPLRTERWLERWRWLDILGARWLPVFGGVHALLAVKRVRGMRLVGLARRQARYAAATRAVAVHRQHREPPGSA
jgi:SAM-dependent methyltransferase